MATIRVKLDFTLIVDGHLIPDIAIADLIWDGVKAHVPGIQELMPGAKMQLSRICRSPHKRPQAKQPKLKLVP